MSHEAFFPCCLTSTACINACHFLLYAPGLVLQAWNVGMPEPSLNFHMLIISKLIPLALACQICVQRSICVGLELKIELVRVLLAFVQGSKSIADGDIHYHC